jgi:hypothetical protein
MPKQNTKTRVKKVDALPPQIYIMETASYTEQKITPAAIHMNTI